MENRSVREIREGGKLPTLSSSPLIKIRVFNWSKLIIFISFILFVFISFSSFLLLMNYLKFLPFMGPFVKVITQMITDFAKTAIIYFLVMLTMGFFAQLVFPSIYFGDSR